jgi:hypothetical protein
MPVTVRPQSVGLPGHGQTLLLRAGLLGGAAGERAWAKWREATPDPIDSIRRDDNGLRRILPLLFVSAQSGRYALDGLLGTTLRTAYLRERRRMMIYGQILERVLDQLTAKRIDALILNGAALAYAVYPVSGIRHCHDIDILTTEQGLARASRALPAIGFNPVMEDARHARLDHDSGLPVQLYTRLRFQHGVASPFAAILADATELDISARKVRVLCPADALLQILSCPATRNAALPLGAFCDAWSVIARRPDLDWQDVIERGGHFGWIDRITPVLGYLRDALEAPIPRWVVERAGRLRRDDAGSCPARSSDK